MSEIPKKYNPKVAEDKWQAYWSAEGTYKWDDQIGRDDTFSVDTPPPTVSGSLHIGHCFSYSHQDFLVYAAATLCQLTFLLITHTGHLTQKAIRH